MNILCCRQIDNKHLLMPSDTILDGYFHLEALAKRNTNCKFDGIKCQNQYNRFFNQPLITYSYDDILMKAAKKLACKSKLAMTMKMLAVYADGNEHCYRDCWQKLFPQKNEGHDIDCWKSLLNDGFIEFSSKHKYGRKFYVITDAGREMLAACEVNYAYHRIARWFKIDEDDRAFEMIRGDMAGEDASNDMETSSFITLLEELFNPESKMHMLGSCFKFMNNVVKLTMDEPEFYEKMASPDVIAWLSSHRHYHGVAAYEKILAKALKKHSLAAA